MFRVPTWLGVINDEADLRYALHKGYFAVGLENEVRNPNAKGRSFH